MPGVRRESLKGAKWSKADGGAQAGGKLTAAAACQFTGRVGGKLCLTQKQAVLMRTVMLLFSLQLVESG